MKGGGRERPSHVDAAHSFASHTRRPEIALLTLEFPPRIGGMQQYLFELCKRLGNECNLTVVHPTGDAVTFHLENHFIWSLSQKMVAAIHRVARNPLTPRGSGLRMNLAPRPAVSETASPPHHRRPRASLACYSPRQCAVGGTIALAYGNDFEAAQLRWHAPILQSSSRKRSFPGNNLARQRPTSAGPGTACSQDPISRDPSGSICAACCASHWTSRAPHRGTTCAPQRNRHSSCKRCPQLLDGSPDLQYWIVDNRTRTCASLEQQAQELGVLTHAVRFMEERI